MKRKGCTPAGLMNSSELHAELEALHPDSLGWALVCCGRDSELAQNTLQAAYLKILNGSAVFEGKSAFKTWLFAVIKRTAAEQRRRSILRRFRLITLDEVEEFGGRPGVKPVPQAVQGTEPVRSPDLAAYRNEVQKMFRSELAALPGRQREVLHLVFYQDLTLAEAAEVLGVSLGSARTHYDRGKRRLKARLIERGVTSNAGLER
jgi:RNA polymerase sigma-70 factor (ECF subfamily)